MPGVRRDYKVPISNNMDSDVPLVSSQGQVVPRTKKIPYVEVQAIFTDWNIERTRKWKSTVGKLAPIAESLDDQMEGSSEHPTKSVKKCTHPTGA